MNDDSQDVFQLFREPVLAYGARTESRLGRLQLAWDLPIIVYTDIVCAG